MDNSMALENYSIANLQLQIALNEAMLSSNQTPVFPTTRADCCNLVGNQCCNLAAPTGPATLFPAPAPFIPGDPCNPCCYPGGTDAEIENYVYQQTLPYIQQANMIGACCCRNKYY